MNTQNLRSWSLSALVLLALATLPAATPLTAVEPTPPPAQPAPGVAPARDQSFQMQETRKYVAQLTEERNLLREENTRLRNQQWLLLVYGLLMTAAGGWLMVRLLRHPAPKAKGKESGETDIFGVPGTGTVAVRKNATITIRNASTQRAEVVGTVQTRAAYARTGTAATTRQGGTGSFARGEAPKTAPAVPAATAPAVQAAASPQRLERPLTAATPKRPSTVRIEQHSDRLEPVDVAVKPGSGVVIRREQTRQGTTIIEVMIALMVFALILSAIASSWFSLRSLQKQTQEDAKVHELAAAVGERIIGANWDWIGRDRPDETKSIQIPDPDVMPQTVPPTMKTIDVVDRYWRRYAWSWHRRYAPRNTVSTTRIRLPPMSDHAWTPEEWAGYRQEFPLTSADFNVYDPNQPVAQRINPHNLVDLGILEHETGIPNLRVYVEYYHADLLDKVFAFEATPGESARQYFTKITTGTRTIPLGEDSDEHLIFPESPFPSDLPEEQMNTADEKITLQALVVRIIITWGDIPIERWGQPQATWRRHEVIMARRK